MDSSNANSFLKHVLPRSLTSQVALITIVLFTLGIMFFSIHVARENASFVEMQIKQSGVVLAKNIGTTGSAYMFSTYYEPLEVLLQQAAHFPNVDELEILDTEGMVIREARRMENGEIKIFQKKHQYKVPAQITNSTVEETTKHIVIWQPIVSGVLQGWVRVEMGLEMLHQQQQEIYRNLLALGGAILLIILATKLLFMRRPMQVLKALTEFASRLDKKHGETIVVDKNSKELEQLGYALNKVSKELLQQEIDIRSALQTLESQKMALDEHSIVSITDVRGNITYANDRFCKVAEYSREILIGQNHRLIKSDQHSDEFFTEMWKTIASGQVWKGEICNKSKTGVEYWVDTTIVPFLDEHNKPYQYVAIRTEVTGLKILAKELADSRDRLEQSQVFANMGNWEWDIKTDGIVWSEQVPVMFGLPKEIRKISFADFMGMVHENDRSAVTEALNNCLENNCEYDVDHRIVLKNGCTRWLHERGNVVRDQQSKPLHMLGVVQDITVRKETEKNMRELELQIRQSQKLEAIGTMAGGIAHDFNNILTSIIGYAELNLMDMQEGTELWDNQNEILFASSRAKEVINQILLFSRKEPEDEKIIRPHYIVNEALRLLRTLISKNISIQTKDIEQHVAILISPTQLHQIIINLCVNAGHAIGEIEKGRITVSLNSINLTEDKAAVGAVIEKGEYAVLDVEDTGCGIEENELEHIFEPFFTTKEVGKGSGMGLSVVYGIVNKAKGAIVVESTSGIGTRFSLYFPVAKVANMIASGAN